MRFFVLNYWHDRRYRKRVGGPIKVIELAENLRAMGHEAILFVPRLGYPEKQTDTPLEQIPVIDIPIIRPLLYSFLTIVRLTRCTLRGRPDVIYIRYMFDFFPSLFARFSRIPCIVEVNDEIPSSYSARDRFLSLLNRINFGCADKIIVLTAGLKNRLVERLGIKAEKISVSTSGTNTEIFYPRDMETCRRETGIDQAAKVIGFAGSFVWNYGVDVLIEASPTIIERFPESKFLIVGDGESKDAWRERVEQLGLEQRYLFPGHVTREMAAIFIGAMDVCVAPYHSSRGETSPVKLYDYLACARPVVSTAIDALLSVQDELPGLILVEPDNPDAIAAGLIGVLENQSVYEAEAMRAKEIIFENYSWHRVASDVQKVSQYILKRVTGT